MNMLNFMKECGEKKLELKKKEKINPEKNSVIYEANLYNIQGKLHKYVELQLEKGKNKLDETDKKYIINTIEKSLKKSKIHRMKIGESDFNAILNSPQILSYYLLVMMYKNKVLKDIKCNFKITTDGIDISLEPIFYGR